MSYFKTKLDIIFLNTFYFSHSFRSGQPNRFRERLQLSRLSALGLKQISCSLIGGTGRTLALLPQREAAGSFQYLHGTE